MRRLLAILLLCSFGRALAQDIPAAKRALILLRVLAYDRNLPERTGESVRVAVLYRAGDRDSEAASAQTVDALVEAAGQVSVAGRPVRIIAIPAGDGLARELSGVVAAYVCPGLAAERESIGAAARRTRTLTFTEDEEAVRSVFSVGLVRRGEKAAILINLQAARAEGADLSAPLLRLAEVVKR